MIKVAIKFGSGMLSAATGSGSIGVAVQFPKLQVNSSTFCQAVDDCLGISSSGSYYKYLNEQGGWVEIVLPVNTLGGLSNVANNTDTATDGSYIWSAIGGSFSLQPFTVDFSSYYNKSDIDGFMASETTARQSADTTLQTALTSTNTSLSGHTDNTSNPHNTTLEQARQQNNTFSGDVNMSNNRLLNLPNAALDSEPATYAQLKQFIDTTIRALEGYNPSSGNFPTAYGGNVVKKGDSFKITSTGYVNGTAVKAGDFLIALIDTPAQDVANWEIGQANIDQATESVQGIAFIATQTEVENELTGENTKIVTPQKFWFGLARMAQLGWTWALKQIFTQAPRFSSVAAYQYLKVDSNKDLTSVSAIPATDVSDDSTHRFSTDAEKTSWNAKAPLNSPAFTGTPTAPTAAVHNNSTQIATTAYVDASVNTISLVGSKLYLFYNY